MSCFKKNIVYKIPPGGAKHFVAHGLLTGPPGVMGISGEWLFIFRELGSTGNYFQGIGEQVHSFGDLGSPAKKS